MKDRKSELLIILQEESSEVVQAVSKYVRFGENPNYNNWKDIETEIGDFLGVLKLLVEEGFLDPLALEKAGDAKIKKLDKYMTNKKVA